MRIKYTLKNMPDNPQTIDQLINDIKNNCLPAVTIDCVIFGFRAGQLKVLLLRWKGTDGWCLPGGYVRTDEDLQRAAHRILRERTGLREIFLQQFYTFGDVVRYPPISAEPLLRQLHIPYESLTELSSRTISVGHYALVEFEQVMPTPDPFTDECRWWDIDQIPALLFDHNAMVSMALKTLRRQLSYQPIGSELLPEKFTMPDLQQLYETILGQSLDRRNFRKRMLGYGILERLDERKTGGAHKAPYLYRFNKEKYEIALKAELLTV